MDAAKVPKVYDHNAKWLEIFLAIPAGKAQSFKGDEARNARSEFYYLKKQGKLPDSFTIQCKDIRKKRVAMIWVTHAKVGE